MIYHATPTPLLWKGREVERVEIADDCYAILASIAQDAGGTVQDQIQRILEEGLQPLFADVIRLHFRENDA